MLIIHRDLFSYACCNRWYCIQPIAKGVDIKTCPAYHDDRVWQHFICPSERKLFEQCGGHFFPDGMRANEIMMHSLQLLRGWPGYANVQFPEALPGVRGNYFGLEIEGQPDSCRRFSDGRWPHQEEPHSEL